MDFKADEWLPCVEIAHQRRASVRQSSQPVSHTYARAHQSCTGALNVAHIPYISLLVREISCDPLSVTDAEDQLPQPGDCCVEEVSQIL